MRKTTLKLSQVINNQIQIDMNNKHIVINLWTASLSNISNQPWLEGFQLDSIFLSEFWWIPLLFYSLMPRADLAEFHFIQDLKMTITVMMMTFVFSRFEKVRHESFDYYWYPFKKKKDITVMSSRFLLFVT